MGTDRFHVRLEQNHMATTFDFVVSCEERDTALADRELSRAHRLVSALEQELTEFHPESPVYRLNQSRPGEKILFTDAGVELLERSEHLRKLTQGHFDCTAKSPRSSPRPRIFWNRNTREVWRSDTEVHLGFGAIGKGFALDRVRLLLETQRLTDYLLSAGGSSILLSGYASADLSPTPWTWGWSWKKNNSGANLGIPFAHTNGSSIAIGVSGTHEKGMHLIDPRSDSRLIPPLSALVATPSAADADALSTALFVLSAGSASKAGWDEALKAFSKKTLPFSPAFALIDSDGIPRWNGGFQHLWGQPAQTGH